MWSSERTLLKYRSIHQIPQDLLAQIAEKARINNSSRNVYICLKKSPGIRSYSLYAAISTEDLQSSPQVTSTTEGRERDRLRILEHLCNYLNITYIKAHGGSTTTEHVQITYETDTHLDYMVNNLTDILGQAFKAEHVVFQGGSTNPHQIYCWLLVGLPDALTMTTKKYPDLGPAPPTALPTAPPTVTSLANLPFALQRLVFGPESSKRVKLVSVI